jgi:hypothetical protein
MSATVVPTVDLDNRSNPYCDTARRHPESMSPVSGTPGRAGRVNPARAELVAEDIAAVSVSGASGITRCPQPGRVMARTGALLVECVLHAIAAAATSHRRAARIRLPSSGGLPSMVTVTPRNISHGVGAFVAAGRPPGTAGTAARPAHDGGVQDRSGRRDSHTPRRSRPVSAPRPRAGSTRSAAWCSWPLTTVPRRAWRTGGNRPTWSARAPTCMPNTLTCSIIHTRTRHCRLLTADTEVHRLNSRAS